MKYTTRTCDVCNKDIHEGLHPFYTRIKLPKFYQGALYPICDSDGVYEKRTRKNFDMCEDCFNKFIGLVRKEITGEHNE